MSYYYVYSSRSNSCSIGFAWEKTIFDRYNPTVFHIKKVSIFFFLLLSLLARLLLPPLPPLPPSSCFLPTCRLAALNPVDYYSTLLFLSPLFALALLVFFFGFVLWLMATVALLSLSSNVFLESREEGGMKNDLIEARIFPLVLRGAEKKQ